MTANAALFLFLAATVVAVFAFLSIAVWVSVPAEERKTRERLQLLRTVAEQPGENAARVLEMLQQEDRKREQRKLAEERRGYILGGLITSAVGVGMSVVLWTTGKGNESTIGLLFLLIGGVLIGAGVLRRQKPA